MSSQSRQSYKQTEIYTSLVEEHDIFEDMMNCFIFAASVGYSEGRFKPDDYTGDGEMLWMHIGGNDLYRAVCASIAYQHTDDPTALTDPDKQLKIMAKFAAGGAEILQENFGDVKGTPREGLLNYIQSQSSEEDNADEQGELLGEIARSFDEELLSD